MQRQELHKSSYETTLAGQSTADITSLQQHTCQPHQHGRERLNNNETKHKRMPPQPPAAKSTTSRPRDAVKSSNASRSLMEHFEARHLAQTTNQQIGGYGAIFNTAEPWKKDHSYMELGALRTSRFFSSIRADVSPVEDKNNPFVDHCLSASPDNNWTRQDLWKPEKCKGSLSVSFRDDSLGPLLLLQQRRDQGSATWLAPAPLAPPAPDSYSLLAKSLGLQRKSYSTGQPNLDGSTDLASELVRSSNKEETVSFHHNSSLPPPSTQRAHHSFVDKSVSEHVEAEAADDEGSVWSWLSHVWTAWMFDGVEWDENGMPYFDDDLGSWIPNLPAWFRFVVFNPIYPELTAIQQSFWAVLIGITTGVFTALWQQLIRFCVEFMWKSIPEFLLRYDVLTDLNGSFPLPFYMVLCPTVCGCVMSYINVILPTKVPGQNEWIVDTNNQGVMDSSAFWHLFFMSTAGMASGLSLGPELPLVLLGGMYGSWLGLLTKQTVLQARVMNLTAASAMVSGFFGFPMAGGLFVLELPHRMGLQYFEALTPATVASIVAVIANRMVTGNDVTGYFHYPFLTLSLPSRIFVSAIVYGALGSVVGVLYGKGVTYLKRVVHGLFHASAHRDRGTEETIPLNSPDNHQNISLSSEEVVPPLVQPRSSASENHASFGKTWSFAIHHEPTRAALVGLIAGLLVGITGLFLPHIMFWGESQLQNLIDKGRTPLPIFGRGDEPTANLTAYGYCMVDASNPQSVEAGFGMGCSALIAFAKIWSTGVSFGTGIVAGQFWGPLFTGCAAGHFFTDMANQAQNYLGFGGWLAAHPCVAILCVMGSSHVVTFRAHTAIALILTLTITSFDSEHKNSIGGSTKAGAGDYSAVFPLLVVAVYVSFILARDYVFYDAQRARGDILAMPEVLCEPQKMGRPLVVSYCDDASTGTLDESEDHSAKPFARSSRNSASSVGSNSSSALQSILSVDIECSDVGAACTEWDAANNVKSTPFLCSIATASRKKWGHVRSRSAPIVDVAHEAKAVKSCVSMDPKASSPSFPDQVGKQSSPLSFDRKRVPSPRSKNLVQVTSFGEVVDHQPSLLDQARIRSSSWNSKNEAVKQHCSHQRYPSLPKILLPSPS